MEERGGMRRRHILTYFYVWFGLVVIAAGLNAMNVNWSVSHPLHGIAVVVVLTMLEGSALEFMMTTIVSIIYAGLGGHRQMHIPRKHDHNLTLLINFNLLAHCEEDIENAYQNMYDSFMSNLSPDVSAVLLSVTSKPQLKEYEIIARDNYRALISKTLLDEGEYLARNEPQAVDPFRLRYFWRNFSDLTGDDLRQNLDAIVKQVANEFMCIHRVSKVLKKCGQYQDLFLLSHGETRAFTYTDRALYSSLARTYNEPLFHDSTDVRNIHCRKFNYCLVMDSDTICPPGTAQELLAVAAAHPTRGIIQPSIKMNVKDSDTIYMHLEMWRQRLNEPVSRSMACLYGQWGFYGKGMINCELYIMNIIGTREHPLEIVPIDVLSHDTYEAAVLRPLYVDSLYFEEEPSYNYITWHIRERRWNQGELILSRYFWPNIFGRPIDIMRRLFDRRNFIRTGVRTRVDFGLVSNHVAHSALRSMFMKPLMLVYIFLQMGVPMHRPFLPLISVLFIVCVFPKFAITNWSNLRYAVLEMFASILQYTPEAFVGSVRLGQALFATICKSCTENWTPQRVIEEDMRHSNPFASSLRHLWAYSVAAIISTVIFAVALPESNLIFFLFATIMAIPLFTGVTSLNPNVQVIKTIDQPVERSPNAPPETLMEEGGPRAPYPIQWTNVHNDPPAGPRYTPPSFSLPPQISYEREAMPLPRTHQSVRYQEQTTVRQSLYPILEHHDPQFVAPRHVVLQNRSPSCPPPEPSAPCETHMPQVRPQERMAEDTDVEGVEAEWSGTQRAAPPDVQTEVESTQSASPKQLVRREMVAQQTTYLQVETEEDTDESQDDEEYQAERQEEVYQDETEECESEDEEPAPVIGRKIVVQAASPQDDPDDPDVAGGRGRWKKMHPIQVCQERVHQLIEPKQAVINAERQTRAPGPRDDDNDEQPDIAGGKGKWRKLPIKPSEPGPQPSIHAPSRSYDAEQRADSDEADVAGGRGTWKKIKPIRRHGEESARSAGQRPASSHVGKSREGWGGRMDGDESDIAGGRGKWKKIKAPNDQEPDSAGQRQVVSDPDDYDDTEGELEMVESSSVEMVQERKEPTTMEAHPVVRRQQDGGEGYQAGRGKWKRLPRGRNSSQPLEEPPVHGEVVLPGSTQAERWEGPDAAGGTGTWKKLQPGGKPIQSQTPTITPRKLEDCDIAGGRGKWKKLTRGRNAVSVGVHSSEDASAVEQVGGEQVEGNQVNPKSKAKRGRSNRVSPR